MIEEKKSDYEWDTSVYLSRTLSPIWGFRPYTFSVDSHHLNLFILQIALKYHICLLLIIGVQFH